MAEDEEVPSLRQAAATGEMDGLGPASNAPGMDAMAGTEAAPALAATTPPVHASALPVWFHAMAAALAPLAALVVPSLVAWPAVAVGAGAAVAAWRTWGLSHAWVAALLASLGWSVLGGPPRLALMVLLALLAAAWRPRWGILAVGLALLATQPTPLGAACTAIAVALWLVRARLQAPRQSAAATVARAGLLAFAAALLLLSFLDLAFRQALGLVALSALAFASLAALPVAWRALDGHRLAWCLAFLVPLPLAAAPWLGGSMRPGLAVFVAVAAVQAPVLLRLGTRSLRPWSDVAILAAGLAWGVALVLL